nr:IS3 family transposase [Bacillus methanolicus]
MRNSLKNSRFKEVISEEEIVTILPVLNVSSYILKTEKLYLVCPKTKGEANQAIQEYIHFCNHSRFQEKLNGLSPIEYREKAAA